MTGERLRKFMRQVPSAVTVVTAAGRGEMRGITIGSFTSVSLAPPLICFNVMRTARMHAILAGTKCFAVHLLREDQAYLSDRFSRSDRTGAEQFDGLAYRLDDNGTPVIEGTMGVLFCRHYATYEAGDHSIIVGEVVGMESNRSEAGPLLYYARAYHRVGEQTPRRTVSSAKGGTNGSAFDPAPKKAKS